MYWVCEGLGVGVTKGVGDGRVGEWVSGKDETILPVFNFTLNEPVVNEKQFTL
jgi:hypothetical protein